MNAGKAASRHARQSDFRGEVVAEARPRIDELAAQIGVAEIVGQVGLKMWVYEPNIAIRYS